MKDSQPLKNTSSIKLLFPQALDQFEFANSRYYFSKNTYTPQV